MAPHWLLLLQIALWLVALSYVTLAILDWVLDSPEVTIETLQAAFCVYLLLGLFWSYAYALMEVTIPGSFVVEHGQAVAWSDPRSRRTAFMRFFIYSYATLTGTGRGDLEPSNGFSDMAASVEAMSARSTWPWSSPGWSACRPLSSSRRGRIRVLNDAPQGVAPGRMIRPFHGWMPPVRRA